MNLTFGGFLQNPNFKSITQSLALLTSGKCYTSYFILQNINFIWVEKQICIDLISPNTMLWNSTIYSNVWYCLPTPLKKE